MSTPTHAEAREILGRFNNSHFNNPGEHARYSIPARPERDDDLRLSAYIDHCQSMETELSAALEREKGFREALERAEQAMNTCMDHCYSDGMVHHQSYNTSAIGAAILEARQALALCTEGKTNTHAEQVKALQREIEILRQYGNKDCTAMADEALEEIRKEKK